MSGELQQGSMGRVHSNLNIMCRLRTVWKMADYEQGIKDIKQRDKISWQTKLFLILLS